MSNQIILVAPPREKNPYINKNYIVRSDGVILNWKYELPVQLVKNTKQNRPYLSSIVMLNKNNEKHNRTTKIIAASMIIKSFYPDIFEIGQFIDPSEIIYINGDYRNLHISNLSTKKFILNRYSDLVNYDTEEIDAIEKMTRIEQACSLLASGRSILEVSEITKMNYYDIVNLSKGQLWSLMSSKYKLTVKRETDLSYYIRSRKEKEKVDGMNFAIEQKNKMIENSVCEFNNTACTETVDTGLVRLFEIDENGFCTILHYDFWEYYDTHQDECGHFKLRYSTWLLNVIQGLVGIKYGKIHVGKKLKKLINILLIDKQITISRFLSLITRHVKDIKLIKRNLVYSENMNKIFVNSDLVDWKIISMQQVIHSQIAISSPITPTQLKENVKNIIQKNFNVLFDVFDINHFLLIRIITNFIRNNTISLHSLAALSAILNTTPEYLLFQNNDRELLLANGKKLIDSYPYWRQDFNFVIDDPDKIKERIKMVYEYSLSNPKNSSLIAKLKNLNNQDNSKRKSKPEMNIKFLLMISKNILNLPLLSKIFETSVANLKYKLLIYKKRQIIDKHHNIIFDNTPTYKENFDELISDTEKELVYDVLDVSNNYQTTLPNMYDKKEKKEMQTTPSSTFDSTLRKPDTTHYDVVFDPMKNQIQNTVKIYDKSQTENRPCLTLLDDKYRDLKEELWTHVEQKLSKADLTKLVEIITQHKQHNDYLGHDTFCDTVYNLIPIKVIQQILINKLEKMEL